MFLILSLCVIGICSGYVTTSTNAVAKRLGLHSPSTFVDFFTQHRPSHETPCCGFKISSHFSSLSTQFATTSSLSLASSSSSPSSPGPKPIDPNFWPDKFPAKNHCSKCGLCETSFVTHVSDACAFIGQGMKRNIDGLEEAIHGRGRRLGDTSGQRSFGGKDELMNDVADESRFGVMQRPTILGRGKNIEGAQWTGCVTSIAVSMLESGMVDAVACIGRNNDVDDGGDRDGWSNPEPILARTVEEVMRGRGVKPALAPSLNILDELRESKDITKLLFCGVGCAVQAFRKVQHELGLEKVYVLGTNCADNSPTPQAARDFLRSGVPAVAGKKILGYEFMQDFRVHVKYENESGAASLSYERMPYFCLPGKIAKFAIADSCLACFDYTNALADVVIGYMAAPLNEHASMDQSYQTITIRNSLGEDMIQRALDIGRLELGPVATGEGNHEKFALATVMSDNIVLDMAGGEMKEEGMPRFMGEVMANIMRSVGPKGVNFARYSIDYHILRNYLHILHEWGEDGKKMVPKYAAEIVGRYLDKDDSYRKLAEKILSKHGK